MNSNVYLPLLGTGYTGAFTLLPAPRLVVRSAPKASPVPGWRPFFLPLVSQVPYDDLRYLFGEIMYGGHITDDWDRRLCRTYLEEFIKPEMLEGELSLAPGFPLPGNMDYSGYHQVRFCSFLNLAGAGLPAVLPCVAGGWQPQVCPVQFESYRISSLKVMIQLSLWRSFY